jgi:hypothetical protein
MGAVEIDRVAVWLDPSAARGGAFEHALDWASRLAVPLRILGHSSEGPDPLLPGASASAAQECAAACAERGVASHVVECSELSVAVEQLFCPRELSVFNSSLPAHVRGNFLRWSLHAKHAATLVCSPTCEPVSRVLVVYASQGNTSGFLDSALSACQVFRANPVILTVARTEKQARQGQLAAERACYVHRLAAHLDYVVGVDIRAAVASIARWRRCSHVFLERRQARPWWRWLRGDTLEGLLGLSNSLTFLALPEAGLQAATDGPALDRLAAH